MVSNAFAGSKALKTKAIVSRIFKTNVFIMP